MAAVDTRKAIEVAEGYEREAKQLLQLAADMRAAIQRAQGGHFTEKHIPIRGNKKNGTSVLALAVEVLRGVGAPAHVSNLIHPVSEKRGKPTSRASIEAALVRGMVSATWRGKIKRTAPSTFTVQ
jgi:hypothetical protein